MTLSTFLTFHVLLQLCHKIKLHMRSPDIVGYVGLSDPVSARKIEEIITRLYRWVGVLEECGG